MSLFHPKNVCRVAPQYQPIFREVGLDAEMIFKHPAIKPWRTLENDRENCTLDATLADGRKIRWHVKRYFPQRGFTTPADDEVKAYQALNIEGIPVAPLVGWGRLLDRSSFVITENLDGYLAGDKLIESGVPFDRILNETADLAARLHSAGLHHRDLYLCHFFIKVSAGQNVTDVRLIDVARVRRFGSALTRRRWIVKDLAQFWYSMTGLPITDSQRDSWLARYADQRKVSAGSLSRSIERKSNWIARHDRKLRKSQPNRNVSIPD